MRSGFRVGRLFGINIFIDWSWIFIFLLVAWNLSLVFGNYHPAWGPFLHYGLAILAALIFFASVLAHELAHSLVARMQGVPVRSITLFLFGGVSNIQRNPPSPFSEFLIAIVGPLTSIILGVLFIVLSGTRISGLGLSLNQPLALIRQMDPLTTMLLWVGPVNIIVGLFNLIPGFPLDGGRILRSLLWAGTDNLRRATRWATTFGHIIAWLMIILGIAMAFGLNIPFFGTGLVSGLWLAFIGWFLNSAATESYRQVVIEDILEGVPVSRVMRTEAPSVPPDIKVSTLVHDHIMGTDEQAFPVVEGERLAGVVALSDVRKVPRENWDSVTVGEIMTPSEQLVTVRPDEEASSALNKLTTRDVRQLPVVRDGQLVGLLRRQDIIRWLQLQSDTPLRN